MATSLSGIDWDEELKRQAAISSLLAQPEVENEPDLNRVYDTQTDEQVVAQPDEDKPETKSDWHKLADEIFPKVASDQPEGLPKAPTIAQDQPEGPPKLAPTPIVPSLITDPESGARYVKDPTAETGIVPYAEPATSADERAFKPGDVTLPQSTVLGPAPRAQLIDPDPDRNYLELNQAEKPVAPPAKDLSKTTGFAVADPDPDNPDYKTPLSLQDEKKFQEWVKANKVPFDDSAQSDYDMRGFWKAAQEGDPNASTARSKFDGRIHFPDQYKTPFHKTFSNESQYATSDAPHWVGDRLVDNQGNVVADETPPAKKGKPVPGFVEGSQNAIVNPAAGVIPSVRRAEPVTYPTIAEDQGAPGTPPKIERAQPVAATPAPTDQPEVKTTDDWYKLADSFFPSANQKTLAPTAATTTGPVTNTNPDSTPFPTELAPSGQEPTALIIHHTSGRNSPQSVVEDWRTNRPGVGSQFIMDRDGVVHDVQKEFGYGGTGHFLHSTIPGVNNHTAVGIEVIAQDDADMTQAQLDSLKKFAGPGGPYANVAVYGHSQVSPGDRDNEGVRGVTAINEARAAGPTAPTGEPGTTPIETLVKLDQSGLNVTHFGYEKPGEEGWDKDSAAGHGKFVENLIPGYDVALNAQARAMVGNPEPGQTFTFAGREWRYGDAASEKLTDPRFDIFDPTGNALSGAAPVGRQVAAAAAPQSLDDLSKDWVTLSPEDQKTIDTGIAKRTEDSTATLKAIEDQTPNKGDLWKKLQSDIPGVAKDVQQKFKDEFQQRVTDYALDYYKGSDPKITREEAFKRATSDADFGTYAGEIWSKILPNFQHMLIAGARATDVQEENTVDQFFKAANPDSTADQRVQLKRQIMALDPQHRRAVLGEMLGGQGDAAVADRMSTIDAPTLFDAFDHISDPVYQTNRKAEIAKAVSQNVKDLTPDPRIAGTSSEIATSLLSSMPKNMLQMGTGVYGESTMMQEIFFDTKDQLAKEHPDWSEDKLRDAASTSTMAQMGPQMIIMRLGGGALNAATKGINQPLLEFAARLGIHSTAGGAFAGVQQLLKNVTTGHSPMEGVWQAVGVGAAQTGIASGITGGIKGHGPEVKPEPVPTEPLAEHGPPIESVPIDTGVEHGPPSDQRPITRGEILGPDEPPEPSVRRPRTAEEAAYNQWYPEKIVEPGQEPLVVRGAERNWTPQELTDLIDRAPSTPEGFKKIMEQVQAPTGWHLEGGFKRSGARWEPQPGNLEVEQTQQMRVNQPPITPTELPSPHAIGISKEIAQARARAVEARGRAPVDLNTAIARQRAAAALGETLPSVLPKPEAMSPPLPPRVSESEPFTSKIANRYTAERMATGELGQIDPSQGKSTEELIGQGLKMSPDQRERLINNFNRGVGGDLDTQGAAIRSKEALLSVHSVEASRAAEDNPTNLQLKAEAEAALKAVTDFHNGPVKKFKRVWSDAGRGLQRDIPLDYSTLNGIKEAYIKGAGNGKEAPPEMGPKLKQTAARVRKAAQDEEAVIEQAGKDIDQEVTRKTRGKTLSSNDQIRARLMEIMNDLPCRN